MVESAQLRTVALWGLCDGASAALLYVGERADRRVSHLCLLNPWVRSDVSLARAHIEHHYKRRVRDWSFWGRLLSGRIPASAVLDLLRSLRVALGSPSVAQTAQRPYQHRMADAWRAFPGQILLLCSGHDYTAEEFNDALANDPVWKGAAEHRRLTRHTLPEADHTLTDEPVRQQADALTSQWLLGRLPPTQAVL
jgi:uncharacterized protein